mmetsp:Transcript_95276/g.269615  ORF Transcript_95276/g.269615 Transcript_95276/m.269615 type:complete len:438 (+) Transcript_95276:93-1406(+)
MQVVRAICGAEGCGCFSMLQRPDPKVAGQQLLPPSPVAHAETSGSPSSSGGGEPAVFKTFPEAPACVEPEEPTKTDSRSSFPAGVQILEFSETDTPEAPVMSSSSGNFLNSKSAHNDLAFVSEGPRSQVSDGPLFQAHQQKEGAPAEAEGAHVYESELPPCGDSSEDLKDHAHQKGAQAKDASAPADGGAAHVEPAREDDTFAAVTLPLPARAVETPAADTVLQEKKVTPSFAGVQRPSDKTAAPVVRHGEDRLPAAPPPMLGGAGGVAARDPGAGGAAAKSLGSAGAAAKDVGKQPTGPPAGSSFDPSVQALGEGACRFKVHVPKPYPGVQYRRSKRFDDRHPYYAEDGSIISGRLEDDGQWVHIQGDIYLPVVVGKDRILEQIGAPETLAVAPLDSKASQLGWLSCCPSNKAVSTQSEVVVSEQGKPNASKTARC